MNYAVLLLLLVNSYFFANAQEGIDYFSEDTDILELSRLIWDNSVNSTSVELLESCIISANRHERRLALIASGVHIEQLKQFLASECFTQQNKDTVTQILCDASLSSDPSAYLNMSIDPDKLGESKSTHPEVFANHILQEILFIRCVKQARKQRGTLTVFNALDTLYLKEYQKRFLTYGVFSDREMNDMISDCSARSVANKTLPSDFALILRTYRSGIHIDKFISRQDYEALSNDCRVAILHYCLFNLDLLNQQQKSVLVSAVSAPYSSENSPGQVVRILAKNILENKTRKEYNDEIFQSSDTVAYNSMLNDIRKKYELTKPSRDTTNNKTKQLPTRSNTIIRPEEKVTKFENLSSEDIISYLTSTLDSQLYIKTPFYQDSSVINVRAAAKELGDRAYFGKIDTKGYKVESELLVSRLVSLGTSGRNRCYEEASKLIWYLGALSIQGLQKEFLGSEASRIQFVGQRLQELKNKEVITWLIDLATNEQNNQNTVRASRALENILEIRTIPIEHRTISKEELESLRVTLVDPYMTNKIPSHSDR